MYTNKAAQRVAFARLRHARRRQVRRAALSVGCSGAPRQRKLSAKATKTKNNSPEENFERKAPARTSPNLRRPRREGEHHIPGSCQTARTQNKVIAVSVITSGPNARNDGVLAKTQKHNSPPPPSPRREPNTYIARAKARVKQRNGDRS